jgi:hypothetical protein
MAIGKFNMKEKAGQILLRTPLCAAGKQGHCDNDIFEMCRQFSNDYFSGKLGLFKIFTTQRGTPAYQEISYGKIPFRPNGGTPPQFTGGCTRYRSLCRCLCGRSYHGIRLATGSGRGSCFSHVCGQGAIVLTSIGEEAVLTAMARQDAKLGMYLLEMRRAAEDLVKLVG